MKRFLIMKLAAAAVVLVSVFAFSSCTKNYYENGLRVDIGEYDLKYNDFRWNDTYSRWEHTAPDEWFDATQLERYEMAGTVIFGTDYCPLPYVVSRYVDFPNNTFVQVVETIGFEATYGRVTFFIQTNEKDLTRENMLDDYKFKVSLFY